MASAYVRVFAVAACDFPPITAPLPQVVPREWLLENNAHLLILSGNSICFTFMASKAVNGRTLELARLVVFLALVSESQGSTRGSCSQRGGWGAGGCGGLPGGARPGPRHCKIKAE